MSASRGIRVGAVGGGPPAVVDELGNLRPAGASWHLEWWVGADDRWRLPANEVAVRQTRVGEAPVVETSMRVPGGDAVARVYGVGGSGRPIVVEVENASPAPFVLALVVCDADRVSVDGPTVLVDRAFVLRSPRAPSRAARTVGTPVQIPVTTGRADAGPFAPVRDRSGRIQAAFLHPVAHRTVLRSTLTHVDAPDVDPRTRPDPAAVVGGWHQTLDRAMRAELPDDALVARIDAARAEVLLGGQERSPDADVVAALEDWGFDSEAEAAWRLLPARVRRRAARRAPAGTWSSALAAPDAGFLLAAKRLLVDDPAGIDEPVAVLRGWREAWRGQSLAVREAPTARGPVSVALRWHGERAAILWEAPPGTTLRAPTLDPAWSTSAPTGEALIDVAPGTD